MSENMVLRPARRTAMAGPISDPWPERLTTPDGAMLVFRRKVGRDQARYGWEDQRESVEGVTVIRKGEAPDTRYLRAERASERPAVTL